MVDAGDVASLCQEHVDESRMDGQMGQDAFDDDEALKGGESFAVALPLGADEDLRHAARGQAIDYVVAANAIRHRQHGSSAGGIADGKGESGALGHGVTVAGFLTAAPFSCAGFQVGNNRISIARPKD